MTTIDTTPTLRTCTKCHQSKPETHENFAPSKIHKSGIYPSCRECVKARMHDYYQRNRKALIAKAIAYEKEHAADQKAYRREYLPKYRAQNRDHIRARQRELDQARSREGYPENAIEQGESSPICRRVGFALVRILDAPLLGQYSARFRAARLDKPIGEQERVVCHFTYVESASRWVCLEAPLGTKTAEDQRLFERLQNRFRLKNPSRNGRQVAA